MTAQGIGAVDVILQCDEVSEYAKQVAVGMFQSSLTSGFLIKAMMAGVCHRTEGLPPLNAVDRERLHHLLTEHFVPVNVLVGMHWYVASAVVLWCVFIIASVFQWLHPYKLRQKIEDALSQQFYGRYAH